MKLSKDDIFFINEFQSVTGVTAKDCINDGKTVSFLVEDEKMGKAIGKNANNIKQLAKKLNKTIEIIGFFENAETFLQKAFNKYDTKIEIKNEKVVIQTDAEAKMNILRNKKRFERIKNFTNRNYNIEEIRLK